MKESKKIRSKSGFWIIIVAAIVLEVSSCIQYFCSQVAIKDAAEKRARLELRCAELEINEATVQLESAAQMLAMMAKNNLNNPKAMYACTQTLLETLEIVESAGIAFIPNYYPQEGKWFEVCSSRVLSSDGKDSTIYTRQIGGEDHDYLTYEWFQNGLTIDSCWWSEPYYDNAGAQNQVVSCSYPITDQSGKVVAVVCIDLSINKLMHISDYLQVYPESYYSIESSLGVPIVDRPDTMPGKKYFTFDEEIDKTGWRMAIIIPESVLYADLKRMGMLIFLLQILGLVLLVFIVLRSAQSVQRLITVSGQQERMAGELEIAQTIQQSMLPKTFPPSLDRLDLNIYGLIRPAKVIGGDLYDFYVLHDKLFFCIGDVSGKGVPASLVMATTRSLFRSISAYEEDAASIIAQINDALTDNNEQNMFVTMFLGVLNLKTGELNYCNAGHNAPVMIDCHTSKVEEIAVKPNLPLGVMEGFTFEPQKIQLRVGDTMFLYTDGLTEAENVRHELFGEERMIAELQVEGPKLKDLSPRKIIEQMESQVSSFIGEAQQSDDLTLMAIRYQQPAIVMRNDIQQIPTLAEWVDSLGIPDELNMPVNLALEEAVTNVMLYAYPGRTDGKVFVEYQRVSCPTAENEKGESLIFTISDSGIPFDPTLAPEADTSLSAEERAIGGLGIHLVRQLMDEISYERSDDKNILTLVKHL
jgi:sigma-B regulation protein RsbU (phosphoserine phosphatase)